MLKEESPVVTGAVGRVLAVLRKRRRGDVVSWGEIEGAAGFERYTQHWPAFFKRLRRDFMRETGICMWPVGQNGGMELLTQQDQLVKRAAKRRLKAVRQFTRDYRELIAVPDKGLSDRQRVIKATQLEASRRGRRAALQQVRLAQSLEKPSSSGIPRPVGRSQVAAA